MSGEVYWPDGIKRGELIYWDGSGATRLAGGQSGYILLYSSSGIPYWYPISVIHHAQLGFLTAPADDHTQYALLAGRSGGQTLRGSPVSGQGLVLRGSEVAGTGFVNIGLDGGGAVVVSVNELTGRTIARGWLRVGDTTSPSRALDVTGDIGGSNELQVPRARISDNLTVVNKTTLGSGALLNLHALDVQGDGIVNANTGYRIGDAAVLGNVLRGNGSNFVSAALSSRDVVGAYSTYVPTVTQGGAVASFTTLVARYSYLTKHTIYVQVYMIINAPGAVVAGQAIRVSLPVAAGGSPTNFTPQGGGHLFDASSNLHYAALATLYSTTEMTFFSTSSHVNALLGVDDFTAALATGDILSFNGTYEVN